MNAALGQAGACPKKIRPQVLTLLFILYFLLRSLQLFIAGMRRTVANTATALLKAGGDIYPDRDRKSKILCRSFQASSSPFN